MSTKRPASPEDCPECSGSGYYWSWLVVRTCTRCCGSGKRAMPDHRPPVSPPPPPKMKYLTIRVEHVYVQKR